MYKSYNELIQFKTFLERYQYLKLYGVVGEDTFGFERYLNQVLYKSKDWLECRQRVIVRDDGCDLGIDDRPIFGRILVHHIIPITVKDIEERNPIIFDLNNLITVSNNTHLAIHYGDENLLASEPVDRFPNDTTPWR